MTSSRSQRPQRQLYAESHIWIAVSSCGSECGAAVKSGRATFEDNKVEGVVEGFEAFARPPDISSLPSLDPHPCGRRCRPAFALHAIEPLPVAPACLSTATCQLAAGLV